MWHDPVLGLKRVGLPISYWRTAEFGYVYRRLAGSGARFVLDVGSPKELSTFLARRGDVRVAATDILEGAVRLHQRYVKALGLEGDGLGKIQSAVQDARSLTYADNSFDVVYSVSVVEHIPNAGDSQALREMVRVARPGGQVIVTVPCGDAYRETHVNKDVYERAQVADKPNFYQRHYDRTSLLSRLVEPSGGDLVDLELWGERWLRVERFLESTGSARYLFHPFEPLISAAFLKCLAPGERGHPMAAFLTLRKPGSRQ
jgi:SAM-dependent methyltransferase